MPVRIRGAHDIVRRRGLGNERTPVISWKRTLQTQSSERFLAIREGRDVAAVDLHYLANGTVAGTVILLKEANWTEEDVPKILQSLDEDFLPHVDLEQGTLTYTVVMGEVVCNYEAGYETDSKAQ